MCIRDSIFGNQVAGVFADDGDAENSVLARRGEHFDEAMRLAVGNRAVEIVDAVMGDFTGCLLYTSRCV